MANFNYHKLYTILLRTHFIDCPITLIKSCVGGYAILFGLVYEICLNNETLLSRQWVRLLGMWLPSSF